MRLVRKDAAAILAACAFAFGACGDDTSPANSDMAVAMHDLAMPPTGDMAVAMDSAVSGDMVMTPKYTGLEGLLALKTTIAVPLDVDAGTTMPVMTTVMTPVLSIDQVGQSLAPDYGSCALGKCCATHFDSAAGKVPLPSYDAGNITISGYTGGNLLTGSAAPSSIVCQLDMTGIAHYVCGYGSTSGPDPSATPFAPGTSPMMTGDTIDFKFAGGTQVGMLDTGSAVKAADGITVSEDLSTIAYDPTKDATLHATSAAGSGIFVVNLTAAPASGGTTSGNARCIGFIGASTMDLKIDQGALAAMLGCDATGANCDSSLNTISTTVFRIGGLPTTAMDDRGNTFAPTAGGFFAGQGQTGTAPH